MEFLGEGAFGKVYKLEENGQKFAIKKILNHDPTASREIELLKTVDHKFIIKYHRSYQEGPHLCIVLEYADEGTLTSLVAEQDKNPNTIWFTEWAVWRFLAHLSSAVSYLHGLQPNPILHR